MQQPYIGIIGAGVVGLGSAAHILKQFPQAKVRIIADKFNNQTTSWGSGGLWEPYVMADTPIQKVHKWGKCTFDYFMDIIDEDHNCNNHGVEVQKVTQFWTDDVIRDVPFWSDIVVGFRMLTEEQIQEFLARGKSGWTFDTIVADQSLYMPWLSSQLEEKGCVFENGKVDSLEDLQNEGFDAIINCVGIGAHELVPDKTVYPVRGQVIRVRAPEVKGVWFIDEVTYVITNTTCLVLGGTQQINNWQQENDENDINNILNNVVEIVPELEGAEVLQSWAGLRPGRKSVRLEKEIKQLNNGQQMKIVHNYGHGGSGVTIHWGCGEEAAFLVRDMMQ